MCHNLNARCDLSNCYSESCLGTETCNHCRRGLRRRMYICLASTVRWWICKACSGSRGSEARQTSDRIGIILGSLVHVPHSRHKTCSCTWRFSCDMQIPCPGKLLENRRVFPWMQACHCYRLSESNHTHFKRERQLRSTLRVTFTYLYIYFTLQSNYYIRCFNVCTRIFQVTFSTFTYLFHSFFPLLFPLLFHSLFTHSLTFSLAFSQAFSLFFSLIFSLILHLFFTHFFHLFFTNFSRWLSPLSRICTFTLHFRAIIPSGVNICTHVFLGDFLS